MARARAVSTASTAGKAGSDEESSSPRFTYEPAPESDAVVSIAEQYGLFINVRFVQGRGEVSQRQSGQNWEITPSTLRMRSFTEIRTVWQSVGS
jgi:hypothetical protein